MTAAINKVRTAVRQEFPFVYFMNVDQTRDSLGIAVTHHHGLPVIGSAFAATHDRPLQQGGQLKVLSMRKAGRGHVRNVLVAEGRQQVTKQLARSKVKPELVQLYEQELGVQQEAQQS